MNAMLTAAHWQTVPEIFAGKMLNSLGGGILIALAGWGLMRAMRGRSSSARFAILFAALAGVVMLPVFDGMRLDNGTSSIHSLLRLPTFIASDLFIAWAAIAFVGLARIVFGFFQLRRLRRSCVTIDPAQVDPLLSNTLSQTTSGRRVDLCVSDRVQVPTAMGFIKPAIVIPRWALSELTPTELNAVLLHEIAHLRRWDDWTNLAQRVVSALLFFHPAVWWIGRGLAREREMACDDFVLASTSDHRGYAQCLVSVAEKSFLRRSLALAQSLAERVHLTAQRVARILDAARSQTKSAAATRIWKPALGVVVSFSAVCLISLPHTPNLVTFDGASAPGAESASLQSKSHSTSRFGANVIPAAYVEPRYNAPIPALAASNPPHAKPAVVRSLNARPTKANMANGIRRNSAPLPVITKLERVPPQSPRVFNTRVEINNVSAANAMLVVMQTERIESDGQVFTISMWQLTVYHPYDHTVDRSNDQNTNPEIKGRIVQKEITPKST
jgi:beta-lactamase regulating signal transducer with metallopeptidase domain